MKLKTSYFKPTGNNKKLKISYFKLIKKNIKYRSYLAAFSAAGMFLLLPVNTLMNINREKLLSGNLFKWAQTVLYKKINGEQSLFMLLFIVLLACLCAVSGFSYLHSRVKQDFYHSLPVKRPRLLNTSYFGGLIIFIVPYVFFALCTILIGHIYHVMTPQLYDKCMGALFRGILMFLLVYNTAVLSMMLTGRTFIAVAAGFVLFFYPIIPKFLYSSLGSIFFKTWSYEGGNVILERLSTLSPAVEFLNLLNIFSKKMSIESVISLVLIIPLTFALSHKLYKIYPSESAEKALALKKSAPVIKILTAVPLSLSVAVFINSIFFTGANSDDLVWWLAISLLSAVIICLVIQFIYDRDLKMMVTKGLLSSLASVVLVVAVLLIFKFDLLGYDRYIPEKENLKKMSLYTPEFDSYFNYNLRIDKEALKTEDFEPIYELADQVVNFPADGVFGKAADMTSDVTICYVTDKGMIEYRDYKVSPRSLADTLSLLCEDEEYKKIVIPILTLDPKYVQGMTLTDITLENKELPLDREQKTRLAEAYLKDVLNADISELAYEPPIAEMTFTYRFPEEEEEKRGAAYREGWAPMPDEPEIKDITKLFIYDSYKRTLSLLEQYGCPVRTSPLKADEVEYIRYSITEIGYDGTEIFYGDPKMTGPSDFDKFNMVKVTEPAEIQEYLDRIDLSDITNGLTGMLNGIRSGRYVEVMFKDGHGPVVYNMK